MAWLYLPVGTLWAVLCVDAVLRDRSYSDAAVIKRTFLSIAATAASGGVLAAFAIADFLATDRNWSSDQSPEPPLTHRQLAISILLWIGAAAVVAAVEWAYYRLWRRYRPMWLFYVLLPVYPMVWTVARDRIAGYR